jgi:hypothetical protein
MSDFQGIDVREHKTIIVNDITVVFDESKARKAIQEASSQLIRELLSAARR